MLQKFSRTVLLIVIVFVLSIILPKYYWEIFQKGVSPPLVYYSSVLHNFVYWQWEGKKNYRYDNFGNQLTREKFEELTPLVFFRSLIFKGKMPDSINGMLINIHKLRLNSTYTIIKPKDIYSPLIHLFPLIESKPNGPRLAMPHDFFRINKKFEFINCESNLIEKNLSNEFNEALIKRGFVFPGKQFYGNPSTLKPFDEGYFVVDSAGQLFQIKRVHNKPFCKKIKLPKNVQVAYIKVTEFEMRQFYGVMITKSNNVYLISYDNYKLIKLPIKNYDHRIMQLRFTTNLFYRTISIIANNRISVFATNKNYKLVGTFTKTWKSKYETSAGTVFKYLFPFSLSLTNTNTSYVDFYFHFNGISVIWGILISLILTFYIQYYRGEKYLQNWFDYLLVLFTGIFGLIGIALIRNEK